MKHELEIDGREVIIDLEERDGRVAARVDQRSYDLEVTRPEHSVYTFLINGQVYEARVSGKVPDALHVETRGRLFEIKMIDRRRRRPVAHHGIEGRQDLVAPMPGKVVRVLLGPGDSVSQGQGVIVVEAMKMQNEIKSPKSGRVVEVRVAEGATVNANQVLAVVE